MFGFPQKGDLETQVKLPWVSERKQHPWRWGAEEDMVHNHPLTPVAGDPTSSEPRNAERDRDRDNKQI